VQASDELDALGLDSAGVGGLGAAVSFVTVVVGAATIKVAAGMAAATNIKQGIAVHTTSAAADWRRRAGASLARRLLQMARNMAANTPAARIVHKPKMMRRMAMPGLV
jgi:hypothetical protein